MVRLFIEWVLRTAGEKTDSSPPTVYELVLIHSLYLLPIVWFIWSLASHFFIPPEGTSNGNGLGEILAVTGGLAAFTVISLIWLVQYRKVPLDMWAVSHLLWITKAYTTLALYAAFGALFFAVFMLLTLFIHPLALVLIYGIPVIAVLVIGVFLWRIVSGYAAFLRKVTPNERPHGRRKGPYYDPAYDPELHPELFKGNQPKNMGEGE